MELSLRSDNKAEQQNTINNSIVTNSYVYYPYNVACVQDEVITCAFTVSILVAARDLLGFAAVAAAAAVLRSFQPLPSSETTLSVFNLKPINH